MPLIPTPADARAELQHLRTSHSKTWDCGDGKRTLNVASHPVHYVNELGELHDIDPTFTNDGGWSCSTAPYIVKLHESGVGFDVQSREGGRVSLSLLGAAGIKPEVNGSEALYRNVAEDLDVLIVLMHNRVKTFRILKSDKAPRVFRWSVDADEAGWARLQDFMVGRDAQARSLDLKLEITQNELIETWSGQTIVRNPETRIKSRSNDVEYPVRIDPTFTANVSAGSDDGYSRRSNNAWYPYQYVEHGRISSTQIYDAGFRFLGVTVPQGATISSATLGLFLELTRGGAAGSTGTLYGYNTDNAAGWTATTRVPSAVARTTHTTAVAAVSVSQAYNYNVTAIVQEIVSRAGWSSGNAMSLLIRNTGTTNGRLNYWDSYDHHAGGGSAPSLSITYTGGGGGGTFKVSSVGKTNAVIGAGAF